MTNKECFIEIMNEVLDATPDFFGVDERAEKALEFYNELITFAPKTEKSGITQKQTTVLGWMQEHEDERSNCFTSKEIGDGLGVGGKSVSGCMRGLVNSGLVEKTGQSPVTYALTENGRVYNLI